MTPLTCNLQLTRCYRKHLCLSIKVFIIDYVESFQRLNAFNVERQDSTSTNYLPSLQILKQYWICFYETEDANILMDVNRRLKVTSRIVVSWILTSDFEKHPDRKHPTDQCPGLNCMRSKSIDLCPNFRNPHWFYLHRLTPGVQVSKFR